MLKSDRISVNFQGMYAQARYDIIVVSMSYNFYEISMHESGGAAAAQMPDTRSDMR